MRIDYVILGSGLRAFAFADAVLRDSNVCVAMIDRAARPGGAWSRTYPFAQISQPTDSFGVNSMPLRAWQIATGRASDNAPRAVYRDEVLAYFEYIMSELLLPTGRVLYAPCSLYLGEGRIHTLPTGKVSEIDFCGTVVDASEDSPPVPHQHVPCFSTEPSVDVISPFSLEAHIQTAAAPAHFVVIGAGRVGVDVLLYLLDQDIPPAQISWVKSREAWYLAEHAPQYGPDAAPSIAQRKLDIMLAVERADSIDEMCLGLEQCGFLSRIDHERLPDMFHNASISGAEMERLRALPNTIRNGHVHGISSMGMVLDEGAVPIPAQALYIDCTGGQSNRRRRVPVFQDHVISVQNVRLCQPSLSAALIGMIDQLPLSAQQKNAVCEALPTPDVSADIAPLLLGTLINFHEWLRHPDLREWLAHCQLDPIFKIAATEWDALGEEPSPFASLRNRFPRVMINLERLLEEAVPAI